ncbi:hypothetical protein N7528_001383 [Penicillium herquei]|nr:hypothetical protein N7528_001383 [Penicillium herquei]
MLYDSLIKDPLLPEADPTVSYWQTPLNDQVKDIQSVQLPSQSDIVVIGSGVSACSTVHELLTGGYAGKITVLEARQICSGATGRNGGRIHVHAMQDYDRFRQRFGDVAAEKIVRFQMLHYDAIEKVARSLGAERFKQAALRETQSVAVAFSEKKLADMKRMLANFEAAFPDWIGRWKIVEAEEAQKKYKIKNATGAMIGVAGAIWPYRLMTAVFATLQERYPGRLFLESNTPVTSVSKTSNPDYAYSVHTPRGIVKAKHVVYCTEAHTAHILPKFTGLIVPRRGQVMVQRPGAEFEDLSGKRSWSFYLDEGLFYLHQNATTGDIILGGGELGGFDGAHNSYGERSDANESLAAKTHLSGALRVLFEHWGEVAPNEKSIKASWSGIMANSLDHVPFVGQLPQEAIDGRRIGAPDSGAEWICAGFSGFGMTNAWMSGVALARQMAGKGVPEWFPEQYRISSQRIRQLQMQLAQIGGSENHLRALYSKL